VTHDQAEAMTLGTRIAIMQNGSIVQVGAPLDLYRRPANVFVGRFLGNPPMNILSANGSAIGIRPEDIHVSTAPTPDGNPGRVLVYEPMGSESLVTVERSGERIVARVPADLQVEAGQEVWLRFPPERMVYFDGNGIRDQQSADRRP
jgi:multiple sugar transport system ATP-binding protein